jgi:hypothetical protein
MAVSFLAFLLFGTIHTWLFECGDINPLRAAEDTWIVLSLSIPQMITRSVVPDPSFICFFSFMAVASSLSIHPRTLMRRDFKGWLH